MTHEDTRIIFGNIADLTELADDFVTRLETALSSVPNGDGENTVGALFVETVDPFNYPQTISPFD